MGPVSQALEWLGVLPPWALLLILSAGALLENLLPPVPADTFVVVGGLLAARGEVGALSVLLGIWIANVAGAMAVYLTGLKHGRSFFTRGAGRHILSPGQVERISRFYARWGVLAIFFARFLPGLRAVVPAFAGVGRLSPWRVAPPLLVASGIWYGILFWLGMQANRSIPRLEAWLADVNLSLLVASVVLVAGVLLWWWRTRGDRGVPSGREDAGDA
ncbi:MAG: DedA family protein [Gemmatimonadales bacterium]|nr:MAG: DedA family protein [Gemmatimonadales bacterium]